jgi:uncharacterized protein (TIGR02246 family)
VSNEQTPVSQALDSYAAAVHAKDVDAFTALYTDNVHIYDSWGQWQYTGIEAWRSMASEWFSSLGDERVQVEFNDVQSVAGEKVAFGHAAVTFAGVSADGDRLRAMTNRFTICLEKKDDAWKISHEHSSLPIDMETGKGIFTS